MRNKLFTVLALFIACSLHAQNTDIYKKLSEYVTPQSLKETLSILAADSMEGRETGTAGERRAANFIAQKFKSMGLLPGNKGSYFMPFTLFQFSLDNATLKINNKNYLLNTDFSVSTRSPFTGKINLDHLLLFLNDNILDTTNLNGIQNKFVLIKEPKTRVDYSRFIEYIKRKKAIGCFVVRKVLPTNTSANQSNLNFNDTKNNFVIIEITENLFSIIKQKETILNEKILTEVPLNVDFNSTFIKNTIHSANVVALLKSGVPSNDYIFVTSHYDHLGIKGGVIYNGADDDGSGSTSVIEIAQALTKAKKEGILPKKNIVFMTVSGEEKGLLGSEFYSKNPIYPLKNTSVDLNIDMVGRIDPSYKGDSTNYMYIIGDDKLSSQLNPITNELNNQYTKLELDRKFNDLNDPNRFYYRSDHYNFASKGVPIIFYFNGVHADYHQPSDKVEKINFDIMSKRVKLILLTTWKIANMDNNLVRDIPLK